MSDVAAKAAEVTGLIQQASEKLHELVTYHMSSAQCVRYEKAVDGIRVGLHRLRGDMARLSLTLGKEGL